jgi:hypothetical protein
VNGVVIEGAPTSMCELLRDSWAAALYPVDRMLVGRFDAVAKIRRLNVPLLVMHGKRDDLVPPEMGVALYMRATAKKSLLLVEGATHGDAAIVDAEAYQAAFERLMPLSPDRAVAGVTPRAAPTRAG